MKPEFIYDSGVEQRQRFLKRLEKAIYITKVDVRSSFLRDYVEELVRAAGKKPKKVDTYVPVKPRLVLKSPEIVHRLPPKVFNKLERARQTPIRPIKIVKRPVSLKARPIFGSNVLYKPKVIKRIERQKKKGIELSVPVPDRVIKFKKDAFRISVPKQDEIAKDEHIVEENGKFFYAVKGQDKKGFLSFGGSGMISKVDKLIMDPNIDAIYCEGANVPVKVDYKGHSKINTNVIFKKTKDINNIIKILAKRARKKVSVKEPIVDGRMKNSMRVQATLGSDYVNGKFVLKR